MLASSKEFLDIQATIECGFTLKRIRDMIRTYSQRDDAESRAAQPEHSGFYVMHNQEWSNDEKLRIVQIDREERCMGRNFM